MKIQSTTNEMNEDKLEILEIHFETRFEGLKPENVKIVTSRA